MSLKNFLPVAAGCLAMVLLPDAAMAGKKGKKGKGGEPPPAGWHQGSDSWAGSCYNPPDFDALSSGAKRMKWMEVRNAIMEQWKGEKGDGVKFEDKVVTNVETVMLAEADRIELVSKENYEQCVAAMSGKGTGAWAAWLTALPGKLTVGECPYAPLDYTLYDYLSVNDEWQIPASVCKGDEIVIRSTAADYYVIEEGGEFINTKGDPTKPASGTGLPCNTEKCFRGQLIMKFVGDSGVESIHAVGTEYFFTAAEHGRLSVMINDDSWTDNKFKIDGGLEHHTGVEYKPAKK